MVFGFFRSDPSGAWPVVAAVPLRFDTTTGALNGMRLNAPVAAIAQFGRPDNRGATRAGEYEYRALGLTVKAYEGRVYAFEFRFDDPFRPDFGSCALEILLPGGRALPLTGAVYQADLEQALERPTGVPQEGAEERTIQFEVAVVYLSAHIALDGRLNALEVDLRAPAR